MKRIRYYISAIIISLLATFHSTATETTDSMLTLSQFKEWKKYIPNIGGTMRARYEWEPQIGKSRFLMRNARLVVSGSVLPQFGYFLQVDFCDAGKIVVLDALADVKLLNNRLEIQAGQMRLPFSIDTKRAPHQLYFSNRSFLAKYFASLSSAGVMASYAVDALPVKIEAGIYNSSTVDKQTEWQRRLTYVARANYQYKGLTVEFGFESKLPDKNRINLFDFNLSYSVGNFFTEAEYILKRYTGHSFRDAHAYTLMASYAFPMKKFLNNISLQARWDGMTDNSNGIADDNGQLSLTNASRNRITGGLTFSWFKQFGVDVRINYEKYLYHDNVNLINDSERDKLVTELIVHF